MKNIFAPLAIATSLGLATAPADAQTAQQVSVALNYDDSLSVADNYKAFKQQVRRTCRENMVISVLTSSRQASRECRAELLDAAVKASGNREMIALHIGDNSPVRTAQIIKR